MCSRLWPVSTSMPSSASRPETVAPIRSRRASESAAMAAGGAAKPELIKKWQAATVTVSDVPAGHLSYSYVSQAVAAGVMPLAAGNFELLRSVSGAEAIEIIGRIESLARP